MLISIITSTYNSASTLPRLINSFRKAKVKDVEWIIIDGASTDGTIDLIKEASDVIDMFVSEPDRGIYDAWNKGLKIAHGEYIGFIGSDDYISNEYFLEAISSLNRNYNIIGFHISIIGNKNNAISLHNQNYIKPYNYPFNLGFFHVGTLHHSILFKNSSFDISYKISGDREFLTRNSHLLTVKIHFTKKPMIFFSLGGISSKEINRNLILKEDFRTFNYIRHNSPFSASNTLHYIIKTASIIFFLLKNEIKKIL